MLILDSKTILHLPVKYGMALPLAKTTTPLVPVEFTISNSYLFLYITIRHAALQLSAQFQMGDIPQTRPYTETPPQANQDGARSDFNWRSLVSIDGLLVSCIVPPLMGFSFVVFGFYVIYGQTTFVISRSMEKAAVVSQAITAISAAWHLIALIPVASLVQRVRSEEWW